MENNNAATLSVSNINKLSAAFVAAWNERDLLRYAHVTQVWTWEGGEAVVFLVGEKLWQLVGHRGEYRTARAAGVTQALFQCFGLEVA